MKLIDPSTGLELTEIQPSPPMRVNDIGTAAASPAPPPPPQPTQAPAVADARTVGNTPKNRPAGKVSVLDGIVFALLGKPEQMQSPEEQKASSRKRAEAGELAKGAAEDPGTQFMGIPSGGGGSGLSSLSNIVRMIGGLV